MLFFYNTLGGDNEYYFHLGRGGYGGKSGGFVGGRETLSVTAIIFF